VQLAVGVMDTAKLIAEHKYVCDRHTGVVPKNCSAKKKLTGGGSYIYGGQEFTLSGFASLLLLIFTA